jgi:phage terminase small subunit
MAGKKLTPRQAIFYGEYIKDGNGRRAAIVAGVPEASAAVTAARWLKEPAVAAAIADWRERKQDELELTAELVLAELRKLAFYDPGNLYYRDGKRIPVHLLDDVTRAAVAMVEDETTETETETGRNGKRKTVTRNQRVKMAEKGQNLERLGRYFKLFTDKVEHDGRVTLEQLVSGHGNSVEAGGGGKQAA